MFRGTPTAANCEARRTGHQLGDAVLAFVVAAAAEIEDGDPALPPMVRGVPPEQFVRAHVLVGTPTRATQKYIVRFIAGLIKLPMQAPSGLRARNSSSLPAKRSCPAPRPFFVPSSPPPILTHNDSVILIQRVGQQAATVSPTVMCREYVGFRKALVA